MQVSRVSRQRRTSLSQRRARLAAAAAGVLGLGAIVVPSLAGIMYWDPNGATSGTGGTGTWNTSASIWRDGSVTGSLKPWSNGNQAVLGGTAGTVTLSTNIDLDKNFQVLTGGYNLRSSTGAQTLTIKEGGSGDNALLVDTTDNNRVFFGSTLAGNALTVIGTNTTSQHNFNIGAGDSAEFLNDLQNMQITKIGTGTLVFSNANKTYAGTTAVNAGTLLVNSTHVNNAAGAYTVAAGATLGGTGNIIRAVTVNGASAANRGVLNPGDPSIGGGIGTLTIGSAANTKVMTFAGNSRLNVDISGATADRLSIFGNLDLDNATTEELLINAASPTAGRYTLVSYTGTLLSAGAPNGFNAVTGVPANYMFINDTVGKTMDLQHRAVPSFALNSPGSTVDAFINQQIDLASTLGNTAPANSASLAVALSSTGSLLANSLASSSGSSVAAGASSSVTGKINTGATPGASRGWQVTNTDAAGLPTGASVSGTVNVYDHASGSVSGTSLSIPDAIVGYSGPVDSASGINVSNAAGFRVDLRTTNNGPIANVSLDNVSALAPNDTQSISAHLASGLGVGAFAEQITLTFADDSLITGASPNLGTATISISGRVLDHSNASFDGALDDNEITVDFGTVIQGSAAQVTRTIYNLVATAAFTAGLDLDSISETDPSGVFSTDLTTFSNLAAGGSNNFLLTLDTSNVGSYSGSYLLNLSDQNLPGATGGQTLTVNLLGQVTPIPEPASVAGLLAAGLLLLRRRRA